jgi:hypothetical protein
MCPTAWAPVKQLLSVCTRRGRKEIHDHFKWQEDRCLYYQDYKQKGEGIPSKEVKDIL